MIRKLLTHIYNKKGRIYKNQKIGSGRIVFALGESMFNEVVGADLTLYRSKGDTTKMHTLVIPEIKSSYTLEL